MSKSIRIVLTFGARLFGLLAAIAATTEADILKSMDGGSTWIPAGLEGKNIHDLITHPTDSRRLIAMTRYRSAQRFQLHITTDGGETWTALDTPGRIRCACFKPNSTDEIWVGGANGLLARSGDGGVHWEKIDLGDVVIGMMGLNHPMHVQGIAFANESIIVAGGQGGGFMAVSHDEGETWIRHSASIPYAWALVARGKRVCCGGDFGLMTSADAGKTFAAESIVAEKLGRGGRFSTGSDGQVLFGFRGTTVLSEDGGDTWSRLASPARDGYVYAAAWNDGRMLAVVRHGKHIEEGPMRLFEPNGKTSLHVRSSTGRWTSQESPRKLRPEIVVTGPTGEVLWLGTR